MAIGFCGSMRDELTAYSPPERTIINAVPYGTAPGIHE